MRKMCAIQASAAIQIVEGVDHGDAQSVRRQGWGGGNLAHIAVWTTATKSTASRNTAIHSDAVAIRGP
jgi:hypothetical protein